jgi:UDP-GlcNAc:undecaprenyl-phosphate GlcNAc-1-phosphate transferase
MLSYACALILGLILSAALTPLFMKLAWRLDFLDRPNTALKVHKEPIPYLGGLAIFLAFALSLLAIKLTSFPANYGSNWTLGLQVFRGIYAILGGGLAALLLGLVDDAHALSPKVKFLGQVLGAILLVVLGLRVRFVTSFWPSAFLTVFWVVSVTNALNFVDIMDGLCAGVGFVAAFGFFLFAANANRFNDAVAAASLAGACLGFLVWNFAPARVYMGDAGSHFIGFSLAAISLNLSYSQHNDLAVYSPLWILALPLFDLMLMTVIRTRKGIPPWKGSPDHIPLRLRALGLSKVQTVLTLYAATLVLCLIVFAASFLDNREALLVWGALGGIAIFLGTWLMGIPMPHDEAPRKAAPARRRKR